MNFDELLSKTLWDLCYSGMNFPMTVSTDQDALISLTLDTLPRTSQPAHRHRKFLLSLIDMMKVEGSYATRIPAKHTLAAFVLNNHYFELSPPLRNSFL